MRLCCLCLLVLAALPACNRVEEKPAPVAGASLAGDAGAPVAEAEKPEEEESELARDLTWVAVSADSKALVKQVGNARGLCRTTCTVEDAEAWSTTACLGRRIDLRFVSNDCTKVVALHQLPEAVGEFSKRSLIHVYRGGAIEYTVPTRGVVRAPNAIRRTGNTFYWLAGALEQPGRAPRYSADGSKVDFETLDGRHHNVPLLKSVRPERREKVATQTKRRTRRR